MAATIDGNPYGYMTPKFKVKCDDSNLWESTPPKRNDISKVDYGAFGNGNDYNVNGANPPPSPSPRNGVNEDNANAADGYRRHVDDKIANNASVHNANYFADGKNSANKNDVNYDEILKRMTDKIDSLHNKLGELKTYTCNGTGAADDNHNNHNNNAERNDWMEMMRAFLADELRARVLTDLKRTDDDGVPKRKTVEEHGATTAADTRSNDPNGPAGESMKNEKNAVKRLRSRLGETSDDADETAAVATAAKKKGRRRVAAAADRPVRSYEAGASEEFVSDEENEMRTAKPPARNTKPARRKPVKRNNGGRTNAVRGKKGKNNNGSESIGDVDVVVKKKYRKRKDATSDGRGEDDGSDGSSADNTSAELVDDIYEGPNESKTQNRRKRVRRVKKIKKEIPKEDKVRKKTIVRTRRRLPKTRNTEKENVKESKEFVCDKCKNHYGKKVSSDEHRDGSKKKTKKNDKNVKKVTGKKNEKQNNDTDEVSYYYNISETSPVVKVGGERDF